MYILSHTYIHTNIVQSVCVELGRSVEPLPWTGSKTMSSASGGQMESRGEGAR